MDEQHTTYGLTDEQFHAMAAAMGSAAAAGQALAEALRPTVAEMIRAYNQGMWGEIRALLTSPRRETVMKKKLRRMAP